MLHDDSQGHYMTVKLIDAIHREVILRVTGPPPSTVIERQSDECLHTFSNPGLFLGWAAVFNQVMSVELWTTQTQEKDNEDN